MYTFVGACFAAVLIAVIGATVLDLCQQPALIAYATESVRI